jgi:hypothetical protein
MEALQLDQLLATEPEGPTPTRKRRRSVGMKAMVPPRACVSRAGTVRGMGWGERALAILASLLLALVMFSKRWFS